MSCCGRWPIRCGRGSSSCSPSEQLCTCHLVELTGARQTNISNHLRVLRAAGLVEARPAGRYTYYRVRPEALAALADHYARSRRPRPRRRTAAEALRVSTRPGPRREVAGPVKCFRLRRARPHRRCGCCLYRVRCRGVLRPCARHAPLADPDRGDQPHGGVEPPARSIRCGLCQHAHDAAIRGPNQRSPAMNDVPHRLRARSR